MISQHPGIKHVAEGIYLLDPTLETTGPVRLQIRGRTYERLMDYLYTPIPLERLTRGQIHVINMLREDLILGKYIGGTDNQIKDNFAEAIRSVGAERVLEWGCGFDSLRTRLPGVDYGAIDIDPWVISYQRGKGTVCQLPEEVQEEISGKINVIPSIFVFQFGITDHDVSVMSKVLADDGFVLANVYRRSPESRFRLRKKLTARGLNVVRRRDRQNLCKGNEYWLASKKLTDRQSYAVLDSLSGGPSAKVSIAGSSLPI